jgi:hypothetical protein
MKNVFLKIGVFLIFFIAYYPSNAQEEFDNSLNNCINLLGNEYISSGQDYIAKLDQNNKATFHTTFYGGTEYRIIACSNFDKPQLILKVFDTEKNLLFSNVKYDYVPFWNLSFTSTVDCVVEISVETDIKLKKPVKLLIGFKKKSVNFE